LAAIPLLLGAGITIFRWESGASIRYEKAQCANAHAPGIRPTTGEKWVLTGPDDNENIPLKQIGCPYEEYETITYGEARAPFLRTVVQPGGLALVITLVVSLAIYSLVRAIGWVIGGFAA
jgi:hypothetical protein